MPPSLPPLVDQSDVELATSTSGLPPETKDAELGERQEDLRLLIDDQRLLAVTLVKGMDLMART
jgi:hypothetical protein